MKLEDSTNAVREQTPAELLDSVALERRLAEARARRAVALAGRTADGAARPPFATAPDRRIPLLLDALRARSATALGGRAAFFAAGLGAGAAAAALVAQMAWQAPSPPDVWYEVGDMSVPAMPGSPPALVPFAHFQAVRPVPPTLAPAMHVATHASLRPEPRPDWANPQPEPARLAARSARNRPATGSPPEVAAHIIGGLNQATIGRAAATLGVRQRVVLPGVTLSLDRRGLRLKPRSVRSQGRAND